MSGLEIDINKRISNNEWKVISKSKYIYNMIFKGKIKIEILLEWFTKYIGTENKKKSVIHIINIII